MLADRVFADVWEAMIHDDGVVPVTAREWAAELSERAVDVTSGLGNVLPRVAPVTSMRADRGAAPVLSAMAIREYDRLPILICTTQYKSLSRLSPPIIKGLSSSNAGFFCLRPAQHLSSKDFNFLTLKS